MPDSPYEQIEVVEALRQSEETYRNLLDLTPNSISVTRRSDGRFIQVNRSFCNRTGYRPEEVVGRTIYELGIYAEPSDRQRVFEALEKDGEIEGLEVQFKSKSGRILENLMSAKPISYQGQDCLLVVTTNIDLLKRTQDDLREKEAKLRNILDHINEGYYEVDLSGNLTFFNDTLVRISGYPHQELMGMNFRSYTAPEDVEKLYNAFNEIFRQSTSNRIVDYCVMKKDGTPRFVESSVSLLRDAAGTPIGFYGILRDRTDQKMSEESLRQSEQRYRTILESMEEGYYEIDLQGNFTYFNASTCRLHGYPVDELMGVNYVHYLRPDTARKFSRMFRRIAATGIHSTNMECEIIRKDGSIRLCELSAYLRKDAYGTPIGFWGITRDRTGQKKLEGQLLHSRKMESVGTLAGGLAHDFNNLLMGIQGNTALMLMDTGEEHPHHANLKSIEQYVKAGAELTRQLLGAAKGGKYEVKPTDMNHLVAAGLSLFGRTKKEIAIHQNLQENLWKAEVDRGQIRQVLLNLFVNAAQAMPRGGDLYLTSQNTVMDNQNAQSHGIRPGKYIKISITDTGVGISSEDLKRIFDPFFTTKDMGHGTGLGLASAYGIISNHGGTITVYSEKEVGSTFNVYLPATEKEEVEHNEVKMEAKTGNETVLLVDDDAGIVDVGRLIMEKLGYRVLTARSGQEALDIYRQRSDTIDLVLLDMIMPGMSGGEAFDQMKRINPDVKVILSSGYSLNGQAQTILDGGCRGFIQKPYNIKDLSIKLREVLDCT